MALAAVGSVGCKKGAGGGGGGGGGWLVGRSGLMANIQSDGTLGPGYDLGSTENLNAIACRGEDEAWVAGDNGTLLYTDDAGESWTSQTVPSAANLHTLATQDAGPVFVGGDGAFLVSLDAGDHWAQLAPAGTNIISIAAAQSGTTVLALDATGGVWSYGDGGLTKVSTMAGAHALSVSPDGLTAVVAGAGLQMSSDAGRTWLPLCTDANLADVRVDNDANIVAVGALGTIVNVAWGGATITTQHVGTANLNTVHVRSWSGSTAVGYAGGAGGEVLVTHDVGATWTQGPNVGRDVMGVDEIGAGHR